uniref:Uncharacterized protein n=1 Tax=Rhizophora mucronata TaxID=61149 RepID=A0A2P2J447_RHIMU
MAIESPRRANQCLYISTIFLVVP